MTSAFFSLGGLLRRWRALCAALLLAACTLPAAAVCTNTETGGALGSYPSQRVQSGTPITTTADFKLGCGTAVVSLLGTPTLKAKITTATTGLTLKNTTNTALTIPYTLSQLGGGSYTQGLLLIDLNGTNAVALLSNNNATISMRITTQVGANVPAGTYTDSITVNWNYANICEGVAVGNACVGNNRSGDVDRTIIVQLVVINDCTITAPDINFGAAPLPSAFPTVSQSISLNCTKGMTFTVGLDPGGYINGTRRQMASGANRLQYNIFKGDASVWGSVGTARVSGLPAADGLTLQTIPYTATVYPDQPNPPAGAYSDTIKVDVQF